MGFLSASWLLAKVYEMILKGLNGFDLKEQDNIIKGWLLEYRVDFVKREKDQLQMI